VVAERPTSNFSSSAIDDGASMALPFLWQERNHEDDDIGHSL
jgi:hypothetical protein